MTNRRTGTMPMIRLPGVYRPQEDTALLIEALRGIAIDADSRVLDVCTGSGAVALEAAGQGARRVTAIDTCRRAVWTARCNALIRRRTGLQTRLADATKPQSMRGFDVIVCNPPYVPTPPGTRPRAASRAWNAGAYGRAVLDPLCDRLPSMLAPGGTLLIVQSEFAGIGRTIGRLRNACPQVGLAAHKRIPFGPVLTDRLAYLSLAGLLPDGASNELIAVVQAVTSAAPRYTRSSSAPAPRHSRAPT